MIIDEIDNGLAIITLVRPEKANSLTAEMLKSLIASFDKVAAMPDLRCVVLTGAGRVFSAGADLDEARQGLALSPLWEQLSGRIAAMPCLTVAALNGALAGGAFGMALACDLRIAVPEARFFYPVMRLGFLPQPSDPARMHALIGPARTKMILMAGQKVTASEALSWGLIDRICDPDALMEQARQLAGDAQGAEAGHVHAIKLMVDLA